MPVKKKAPTKKKVVDVPDTARTEVDLEPDTAAALAERTDHAAVMIGTPPPENLVLETSEGEPNITIKVFTPFMAVLARCATVFFSSLLGGLGLATASDVLPAGLATAIPLVTWKVALTLAVSSALVEAVRSMVTISSELEKKYPLLRA